MSKGQNGILITGATGFIGQNLFHELKRCGNEVVGTSKSGAVEDDIKPIDLVNHYDKVIPYLKSSKIVFHLAASLHNSNNLNHELNTLNTEVTKKLFLDANKYSVQRFFFFSTALVNGDRSVGQFDEEDQPQPCSEYAHSKYRAELELQELARTSNTEVIVFRLPLVYGKNPPANLKTLIRLIDWRLPIPLAGVLNKRSYIAMDNILEISIKALGFKFEPRRNYETFLLGDGCSLSTVDLIEFIASARRKKIILIKFPLWMLRILFLLIGKRKLLSSLTDDFEVNTDKVCQLLCWTPRLNQRELFQKYFKED